MSRAIWKETRLDAVPSHLSVVNINPGEQELPPEAYVISALVQSGSYNIEAHGLTNEHFMSFRQVNLFLRTYQEQARTAPPLHLLLDKFPRFPFQPGVSAVWACKQLQLAHRERHMLRSMAKVGTMLSEGRIDEAGDLWRISAKSTSAPVGTMRASNAYAPIVRPETDLGLTVPVLAGTMTKYCQGIQPGNLWYISGIPGMGKSYRLVEHAILAVEAGWDVAFFSLEMPEIETNERIQKMLMPGAENPFSDEFYETLAARTAEYGALTVYTGPTTIADIESVAVEGTLVIIDYVSKIRAPDGLRAITDYRLAAALSAELRDIALHNNVPVLSAIQLNRSAYNAKESSMSQTAETDQFNKDPSVMISMLRMSETVILNTILKNRSNVSGRKFYTRFSADSARAVELSFDEANEAMYEDAEKSITH